MKHTLNITAILIAVFFVSQVIGLLVVNQYLDYTVTSETGEASYSELPFGIERPEVEESSSFVYILVGVLLGTCLLLLLIKFKGMRLWKLWYFLAVIITLTSAFGAFVAEWLALAFAFAAGVFKVFKPNMWVHNISEIFVYGGLAAIFVPVINIFSAFMLLLLISLYDMYAVWKSKHMVKMAQFQTASKLFAGLSIPYHMKSAQKTIKTVKAQAPVKGGKVSNAILGGGDIAFPLIFSAVVMKELAEKGVLMHIAFIHAIIISIVVTVALAILLFKSQKGKFYPAMPFISLGCVLGYVITLLL